MDLEPRLAARTEKYAQPLHERGFFVAFILIVLMLLAIAVSIFGTSSSGPIAGSPSETPTPFESQPPRLYTVSYKAGVFSPTNLRIHAGDTVRFRNDHILPIRIASDPHPEHNDYAGFDSIGDIPPGSYFGFTFAAKGTFGYHNEKNPKETAVIIVR